jgi:hypothetical protein
MGTTLHGLPYPEPTDPVADGAAAIEALAEAIDTSLGTRNALAATATGTSIAAGAVQSLNWDFRDNPAFGAPGHVVNLSQAGVWVVSAKLGGPANSSTITVYTGSGGTWAVAQFAPSLSGIQLTFQVILNAPEWFYFHIWNADANAQWFNGALSVAKVSP